MFSGRSEQSEANPGAAAPSSGPGWYCARSKPKHEHIAAANLANRLCLEVFCPRMRMERMTRRGIVRTMEPLFPGYVFTRCVLEEQIDSIRHTSGISSVVHFGGHVPQVPDEVIAELRKHFDTDEPVIPADPLTPGTEVVMAEGAFEGMRASVLRVLPAQRRVQVLLDILGRPTEVEVNRGSVAVEGNTMAEMLPFLAAA